jgi:hypothetical protein
MNAAFDNTNGLMGGIRSATRTPFIPLPTRKNGRNDEILNHHIAFLLRIDPRDFAPSLAGMAYPQPWR